MLVQQIRWHYRAWRYRLLVEQDEIGFVRKQLNTGDVAVDIGAHKGAFTYWMRRRVGAAGRVYAFEPQPVLAKRLQRLNAGVTNVTVENMGVSSQDGVLPLTVPGDKPTTAATLEPSAQRPDSWQSYQVPVTTLDSYFPGEAALPVKLVKCDVEGHEVEVFRGGQNLLSSQHPILLFECEARVRKTWQLDNVFDFLLSLGYTGWFFCGRRLVDIQQFDAPKHQSDPDSPDYANNFVFAVE